jgi:hypothetical protein
MARELIRCAGSFPPSTPIRRHALRRHVPPLRRSPAILLRSEYLPEEGGGAAYTVACNLRRRTSRYDFSAGIACLGADIKNVIRLGDNIEVMFDKDYRISIVDQAMQDLDEQFYVSSV